MVEIARIGPEQIKDRIDSGEILLVCAYDDEEKFKRMHLKGAIPLSEFKSQLPSLSKEQEIVFYCA